MGDPIALAETTRIIVVGFLMLKRYASSCQSDMGSQREQMSIKICSCSA